MYQVGVVPGARASVWRNQAGTHFIMELEGAGPIRALGPRPYGLEETLEAYFELRRDDLYRAWDEVGIEDVPDSWFNAFMRVLEDHLA